MKTARVAVQKNSCALSDDTFEKQEMSAFRIELLGPKVQHNFIFPYLYNPPLHNLAQRYLTELSNTVT